MHSKDMSCGVCRYLLSVKWFRKWKKYVGFDPWNQQEVGVDCAYPGPIDNSDLFAGTVYHKYCTISQYTKTCQA